MKKITLLFALIMSVSFVEAQSPQPYLPFVVQNVGKVEYEYLRVQTGQPTYYLDVTDGIVTYTYILTDWQGSVGNVPTVFDSGWSLRITFSPCDKILAIRLPNEIQKVRDANYNEYIKLAD